MGNNYERVDKTGVGSPCINPRAYDVDGEDQRLEDEQSDVAAHKRAASPAAAFAAAAAGAVVEGALGAAAVRVRPRARNGDADAAVGVGEDLDGDRAQGGEQADGACAEPINKHSLGRDEHEINVAQERPCTC